MPKVRILVLTSSTGGGHDARARAFAEWCFRLYRHDVEVRIEQMLEESSALYRGGVNFYNWIQRRQPWLHKGFYALVEGLSVLNRRTVTFGRGYYEQVLRRYRPHLVLSVHDCLNRGYFQLARKTLGPANVRCATYCSEFAGGWGYSRNWVEPTVDVYFSRTPTAGDYAIKLGLPPAKVRVKGSLLRPRAYFEILTPEACRRFRENELGLHKDRFTVFLATGTNGANNHLQLLPALLDHADRMQAIVVCGRNQQAYNEMVNWRAQHPEFSCFIDSFSQVMHLLMQASDAIVTRGGTTTCAKALFLRCPIIFNAFGGVMPQERLTVKFFLRAGAAELVENAAQFRKLMDRWAVDPDAYRQLRHKFTQLRHDENPTMIIDELVGLAQAAAGMKLERRPLACPTDLNDLVAGADSGSAI